MPGNVSAALRPTPKWPLLTFLLIWTAFGLCTCTEGNELVDGRSASTLVTTDEQTPLDKYVKGRDRNYSYRVVQVLPRQGYDTYVLEMTSQTWLTPKQVDRVLWKHWLTIVVPGERNKATPHCSTLPAETMAIRLQRERIRS